MTIKTAGIALTTVLSLLACAGVANARGGGGGHGGGGMVGSRGGGGMARPSFGGSASFSRPSGGNVGNVGNPASAGRPANFGERPAFGGINQGAGNVGARPGNIVGERPGTGNTRNQFGDHLGVANRPTNINQANINRPTNINQNNVNRPTNINQNNINRQNNLNQTNINRPVNVNNNITNVTRNNVTNVNRNFNAVGYGGGYRPGYGGYRPGYGYGGWGAYGGYRPNPYYAYHRGWVNGYWNGNNAGWGWNNWGNSALGWGVGIGVAAWGIGSLLNTWGYSSYANPYYGSGGYGYQQPTIVAQQPMVYDYSRPLDVTGPPPAQGVIDQAVATFDTSRQAFKQGDYPQALAQVDEAIKQTPNDPMLHEFRAICLFALGRYDEAAVPLYSVLSVGPGWDWTTLVGLYPSVDVYTQQFRALENYIAATPKAASARFLLATLYMTQGNNDAAATMLQQVVALQPRDKLSAQLLDALTPKSQAAQAQPTAPPAVAGADQPPPNPVPAQASDGSSPGNPPPLPTGPVPAKLVNTWTASPAQGVNITLSLDNQKSFDWKVGQAGQPREFKGQAAFDNDVLALIPLDQPPMVGTVTWKDDSHFQFKALGVPADDPGLNFSK